MQLSIVIVNYNVKYFLEQTLLSVQKAIMGLDAEVFVVDNNSVDGSVELVQEKFNWVHLIALKENTGFSRGNNVAIKQACGKYVLLLNPDTVLQEDTLKKCIEFADSKFDFGALGVRMIDGKGLFLPESKRGLPTPQSAFYKMVGLASLFPKSRKFGSYHLKYLNEFENHEVDVLSGAFMFMSKAVIDQVGMLDEAFFMYGEDIDLSYRITQSGFKNYYFSQTSIIHYKGESTKKKSANYVKIFYQAMVIFARKHYSSKSAGTFARFINLAIWLRASIALFFRVAQSVSKPLLDFIALYLGYFGIAWYWENYNKFVPHFYPTSFYKLFVPALILITLFMVFVSGGYDKPYSHKRLIRGAAVGAAVQIGIYAFLPKEWQFSRAILGLGAGWSILVLPLIREMVHFLRFKKWGAGSSQELSIAIVADTEEYKRINLLLHQGNVFAQNSLQIAPTDNDDTPNSIKNLDELVQIFKINTLIFSAKNMDNSGIMEYMNTYANRDIQFKIVPESSLFIIGSNSKNQPGELYTIDIKFAITNTYLKRKKRILDILISMLSLLLFPLFLMHKAGRAILFNAPKLFIGNKTLVSYNPQINNLPFIKPGVFTPWQAYSKTPLIQNIALAYARDYSPYKDLEILLGLFFNK